MELAPEPVTPDAVLAILASHARDGKTADAASTCAAEAASAELAAMPAALAQSFAEDAARYSDSRSLAQPSPNTDAAPADPAAVAHELAALRREQVGS